MDLCRREPTQSRGNDNNNDNALVRGLTDKALPQIRSLTVKRTSIAEVLERKRRRHDEALQRYKSDSEASHGTYVDQSRVACAACRDGLVRIEMDAAASVSELENEATLASLSLVDIGDRQHALLAVEPARVQLVSDMTSRLELLEQEWLATARTQLGRLYATLVHVGHELEEATQARCERLALEINSEALRDRRALANTVAHLLAAGVSLYHEREQLIARSISVWSTRLRLPHAVDKCAQRILLEYAKEPEHDAFDAAASRLQEISRRRKALIEYLQSAATQSRATDLHEQLERCRRDEQAALDSALASFDQWGETTATQVRAHIQQMAVQLSAEHDGLFESPDEARDSLTDSLTPTLEREHTRAVTERHERLRLAMKHEQDWLHRDSAAFLAFYSAAAGIREKHETYVEHLSLRLRNDLDACRQRHTSTTSALESELNAVIDRVREGTTTHDIQAALGEAHALLQTILGAHHALYSELTSLVRQHPSQVEALLNDYSTMLTDFFRVAPSDHAIAQEQLKAEPDTKIVRLSDSDECFAVLSDERHAHYRESIGLTLLSHAGSFTLPSAENNDDSDNRYAKEPLMQSIREIARKVPCEREALLQQLRVQVRHGMLEHMCLWTAEIRADAERDSERQCEELSRELDLRLKLHAPRNERIERGVRDTRAAELGHHQLCIDEHAAGVERVLEQLRESFQELQQSHFQRFGALDNALATRLTQAETSVTVEEGLGRLKREAEAQVEETNEACRLAFVQFRRVVAEHIGRVTVSTGKFQASIKTFSEGGNYSADEAQRALAQLSGIEQRYEEFEGDLMGELAIIENNALSDTQERLADFDMHLMTHKSRLRLEAAKRRVVGEAQVRAQSQWSASAVDEELLQSYIDELAELCDALEAHADKSRHGSPSDNARGVPMTSVVVLGRLDTLRRIVHARARFLLCLGSQVSMDDPDGGTRTQEQVKCLVAQVQQQCQDSQLHSPSVSLPPVVVPGEVASRQTQPDRLMMTTLLERMHQRDQTQSYHHRQDQQQQLREGYERQVAQRQHTVVPVVQDGELEEVAEKLSGAGQQQRSSLEAVAMPVSSRTRSYREQQRVSRQSSLRSLASSRRLSLAPAARLGDKTTVQSVLTVIHVKAMESIRQAVTQYQVESGQDNGERKRSRKTTTRKKKTKTKKKTTSTESGGSTSIADKPSLGTTVTQWVQERLDTIAVDMEARRERSVAMLVHTQLTQLNRELARIAPLLYRESLSATEQRLESDTALANSAFARTVHASNDQRERHMLRLHTERPSGAQLDALKEMERERGERVCADARQHVQYTVELCRDECHIVYREVMLVSRALCGLLASFKVQGEEEEEKKKKKKEKGLGVASEVEDCDEEAEKVKCVPMSEETLVQLQSISVDRLRVHLDMEVNEREGEASQEAEEEEQSNALQTSARRALSFALAQFKRRIDNLIDSSVGGAVRAAMREKQRSQQWRDFCKEM